MARLLLVVGLLLAVTAPLRAEQYWVAYEGNDFPENEGWTRIVANGGAVRTVVDGVLTLDGRASALIADACQMSRPVDPSNGEMFVMQWRLRVDSVSAREDPTIAVFSDDGMSVAFEFAESYLISVFEPVRQVEFEPFVWHEFELNSTDMRRYTLSMDGVPILEGECVQVITTSEVGWGDSVVGTASLSRWDYVRFGVVPEPATAIACAGGLVLLGGTRGRVTA